MADTPLEYFNDPRKKSLDHLSSECFALEQLAKQYGHPDIQNALYRVRATELRNADVFLRGQIRREVESLAAPPLSQTAKQQGIVAGDGQPCPNDHDPDCRWPDCNCRSAADLSPATEVKE